MNTLITVIHVCTAVFMVVAILVQSGKGAEISASFGGSSQTVFGTSGGANFLVKFTQGAAAVFMFTSILLTVRGTLHNKSLFEVPATSVPAATAPAQTTAPAQGVAPGAAAPVQTAPGATAPAQKAAAQPGATK